MNVSIINSSLKYLNKYELIVKLVSWIYEELRSIYYEDFKLESSLKKKDVDVVKDLIHLVKDKSKLTEYLITYINNVEILKLLIDHGSDVLRFHSFILYHACLNEYHESVKLLLENGYSYDKCLIVAISKNYYKIVKLLLLYEHKGCMNGEGLRIACSKGHCDIVELLLDHDADPSLNHYECLTLASKNNHRDIVRLLARWICQK
jgi:ankyrin repeat protein